MILNIIQSCLMKPLMLWNAKTAEFHNSLYRMLTLLAYEKTAYDYFEKSSMERLNDYTSLMTLLSNTMMIEDDIAGIILYDMNGDKLAGVGKNFEVSAKLDDINTIRTNIKPQQASFFDTERPELSLGLLALAVLGGFILNFMPCVFPVLALKILAITKFGGSNAAKVRRGFLFTCLGLVTAFLILIGLLILLKSLGYALGWGMQFQSTSFLLIMSFVLIVFMLQIAGIINLGTPQWADRLLRSPNQSEDLLNFLTGLLLVLLSTPCSAPYLGTAIGFALAGSYSDIVIIMTAKRHSVFRQCSCWKRIGNCCSSLHIMYRS